MAASGPAVFLDRDGTLVEDVGFLKHPDEVHLFSWSADAVRRLNAAGLPVIVVTNQSGIARGVLTEAGVADVHRRLSSLLEAEDARIDAYYYCPHHPHGTVEAYAQTCACRKPGRGMVDQAARHVDFDATRSFVVGDKWLDVGLARTVGARGVLVRTGYGRGEEEKPQAGLEADVVVDHLGDAVSWILERIGSGR